MFLQKLKVISDWHQMQLLCEGDENQSVDGGNLLNESEIQLWRTDVGCRLKQPGLRGDQTREIEKSKCC